MQTGYHRNHAILKGRVASGLVIFAGLTFPLAASAIPSLTTIHTFDGAGGSFPIGIASNGDGNLYGMTSTGGTSGDGTAFGISTSTLNFSTRASFNFTVEGEAPMFGVAVDSVGNLYTHSFNGGPATTDGALIKVAAGTNAVTAYTFDTVEGSYTNAGPMVDSADNVYGTTLFGGPGGLGVLYKLAAGSSALTRIASFDGSMPLPSSTPAIDGAGNIYGSTLHGGVVDGTIFKVDGTTGTLTTAHALTEAEGTAPTNALKWGPGGKLYGQTYGNTSGSTGRVFTFDPGTDQFTTLAKFTTADGGRPRGDLLVDDVGNVFGITQEGGSSGKGSIFKIAFGSNVVTTLYSFSGADGRFPSGGLVVGTDGSLYGVTSLGGLNDLGTAFKLDDVGYNVLPEPTTLSLIGGVAVLCIRRRK